MLREAELKARQMMNAAYSEKQAVEQATLKARGLEEGFRLAFRQMLQGYLNQAELAPEAATSVPDARSDFARHADAIREAINREESAMHAPEAASASLAADAGRHRAESPAPAEASAPSPKAAGVATPQTPPPERRPGEGVRILFGERDDLLADVDNEVDENGFKW